MVAFDGRIWWSLSCALSSMSHSLTDRRRSLSSWPQVSAKTNKNVQSVFQKIAEVSARGITGCDGVRIGTCNLLVVPSPSSSPPSSAIVSQSVGSIGHRRVDPFPCRCPSRHFSLVRSFTCGRTTTRARRTCKRSNSMLAAHVLLLLLLLLLAAATTMRGGPAGY
jgi:hypothetical protein